jgi:hypothetical protein
MIFQCSWYSEDDYGPLGGASVIVQADCEEDAIALAKESLVQFYSEFNFEEYPEFKCEDLTSSKVIQIRNITCFG